MSRSQRCDLVRMTATELQALMQNGDLTSVELIKESLAQIQRHNKQGLNLKAVISVAPEELLLERAAVLDEERAQGKLRGPLHGIPVLIKDVVKTHSDLGMPTTLGSFALLSARANSSATIVEKMMERGLVILAKTNLNELSSWKSIGPMNGWSAVGGQTNSAYVEGGVDMKDGGMGHTNPCGASTGSAVGVSAGFSPVAIGSEVDGSLVQPAARAALFALKPTIGSTELGGVFTVSPGFDSLGAMAKSTTDLAIMTEMVLNPEARAKIPSDGYVSFMKNSFAGLNVGFVDPEVWRWPENVQPQHQNSAEQMRDGYLGVMDLINRHGGKTVHRVSLPPASTYMVDGQPATILAIRHAFKQNVDEYLGSLASTEVRTAEDIIQYNIEHADKELPPDFPEQGRLIDTLENPISRETYEEALAKCRKVGRDDSVDKAILEHNLDLIAFPMDSPCPRVAAASGYPIGTVPLGTLDYNGRPFGLAIIAQAGREDLIFQFMSAFETLSKPRAVPQRLVN